MRKRKPRYAKPPKGLRPLTVKEAKIVLKGPSVGSKQDLRHAQSVVARSRYGRRKRAKSFIKRFIG